MSKGRQKEKKMVNGERICLGNAKSSEIKSARSPKATLNEGRRRGWLARLQRRHKSKIDGVKRSKKREREFDE